MTSRTEPTAERQAAAVLAADAQHVRSLTGLTLALWLSAGIGAGGLLWFSAAPLAGWTAPPDAAHRQLNLLGLTVAVLTAAGVATTALVFATRRATLRQIQASLADISAQLAALRTTKADEPTG
ncbi:MAG: hypothetical protein U0871_05920 [Gemmataceae bacterium]